MANYHFRGKLTTPAGGGDLADLAAVAYKPHGLGSVQIFGSVPVKASGHFEMTFDFPPGSPPEMYVMPVPAAIEKFGVLHIEMSAPGIYFPKAHVLPTDWAPFAGGYETTMSIAITADIWRRWAWLSEEFTVSGLLLKAVGSALLPIPFAQVWAADVDLPKPGAGGVGGAITDQWGRFTIRFRRIDFFIDFSNYVPAVNRYGTEYWPNLIFSAVQKIGGQKTEIYREAEGDARPQAMWDTPNRLLFVRLVTEEGVANGETLEPLPAGVDFLFHGIGMVKPHSIVDGYATTGPTEDVANLKDCPFGSTLHVNGQFDQAGPNPPKYYQVLYARWTGAAPPGPAEFQPILHESWTASKFDMATLQWDAVVVEALSGVVAGEKVYEIPDYGDITLTDKTRLIAWRSHRTDNGARRYPDGKYDLLIKAWDAAGNPAALNAAHPELNRLTVMIDNVGAMALLKMIGTFDILRTDGMMPYTPVCPVFSKTGGVLPVLFDAVDALDHFWQYQLSFITGHNFYVDTISKVYDGKAGANERFKVVRTHRQIGTGVVTTTPLPDQVKAPGGFADEVFNWNIASPDVVKCAYQARLGVWARTINGYGHIHYAEDTMHFAIEP